MEHQNPTDYSFNDITGSQLAIFFLDVFIRAYGLKPIRQPLDADFILASKTRFNLTEMLKSWTSERSKFLQRKDDLDPITWFREPYSLITSMLCKLYGLPNCSIFKDEWAPVAHHILTTGSSFPWASILSLELKNAIQSYQNATTRKKPNLFLSAFVIDVFCTHFQYPNSGWIWAFPSPPVPIYYSELWDTNYVTRFNEM